MANNVDPDKQSDQGPHCLPSGISPVLKMFMAIFLSGEALTPGMNQLCNNIMGHLNNKGLYPAIQILLTKGLARTKPAFTKTSLSAIVTLSVR